MGNHHSKSDVSSPYAMSVYMDLLGYKTQTTEMNMCIRGDKVAKPPGHQWRSYNRKRPTDTALMVMMGDIFVIDIDDKIVGRLEDHLTIPEGCWVEYTASGGAHIYFTADPEIRQYNTTIKLQLWGFKEVDILIKNGFAYAGTTRYTHPWTGKLHSYHWDPKRNPLTIPVLGKVPEEWQKEIVTGIKSKRLSFLRNLRPILLGCEKCRGLISDVKNYPKILRSLYRSIGSHAGAYDLILEWSKKQSWHDDAVMNFCFTAPDPNPYTADPIWLKEIYAMSQHAR